MFLSRILRVAREVACTVQLARLPLAAWRGGWPGLAKVVTPAQHPDLQTVLHICMCEHLYFCTPVFHLYIPDSQSSGLSGPCQCTAFTQQWSKRWYTALKCFLHKSICIFFGYMYTCICVFSCFILYTREYWMARALINSLILQGILCICVFQYMCICILLYFICVYQQAESAKCPAKWPGWVGQVGLWPPRLACRREREQHTETLFRIKKPPWMDAASGIG